MRIAEKLIRDIDTLSESIRLDREDLANLALSAEDRLGILKHVGWCLTELGHLQTFLGHIEDANRPKG